MDPQGRTVVLWPEQTGLFASRDTGTGWSPKARISREYGHSFHAQQGIGLSAMGSALGLWSAGAARITEIASNRFDPASGWSSPEVVWAAGADDLTNPALAVASSGLALAAWAEGFGSDRRLWWTTFDPKRGWAVAQTVGLAAPPRLQIYGVSVALNASGQGFITWIQDDTAFASRYTTVEGPAAPEGLGQGGVGGLEVDADGNAAAVLNQPLGQPPGLMFRRFRTGANAWDPPQPLAPEDTGGVGTLSMDTRGNAWILWCERRGVWARRFDLTRGLLPPEQISPESGTIPQVVADSEGGAMAVWVEVTGSPYTIKASRYTPR